VTEALLTADAVAELLGLSRAQVYLLKHEIGFVQLGRVVRFDPNRVRAYVDEHRRGEPEKIRAINVRRL
jgi:excisionase family DNA binding protein